MNPYKDLPAWLWLWSFVALLVIQLAAYLVLSDPLYSKIFEGEFGLVELLTAILLIPAAIAGLLSAGQFWQRHCYPEALLLVVFAMGCVFLCGEEISWGQHLFQWNSPDYFQENNLQGETNLHNLAGFNKSLLKWLMIVGIMIGGIFIPLWARKKPEWQDPQKHRMIWLFPTYVCLPVALFVVVSHLAVKIVRAFGVKDSIHDLIGFAARETTELYISAFCLFYALSLLKRQREAARVGR